MCYLIFLGWNMCYLSQDSIVAKIIQMDEKWKEDLNTNSKKQVMDLFWTAFFV